MTKSLVIYFSQSGNTQEIARAVVEGITGAGEPCDLVPLREVKPPDVAGYDLIGLGSPVIHGVEPPNVTAFIQSLQGVDEGCAFAFCTHGALPGRFLARVVPAMIQRGLTVVGWRDWFAGAVFPFVPKPYFSDGHPDEIDLKEARDFGQEMVERSRRLAGGDTAAVPVLPRGSAYDRIYMPAKEPHDLVRAYLKVQAQTEFKVNRAECRYPKCTHCLDNCPMGSIDFSVSPPVFDRTCMQCWFCARTCPAGAIEVDWPALEKAHDPLVRALLEKSFALFEARGRFRPLVPPAAIGWDTPAWRLYRARP